MRDETVAEFMERRQRLEALACPSDADVLFFNEQMTVANEHGMQYQEALEFIVRMRHGGAH